MKTSVSFCDFCDAFRAYDRQDSFSYEAKRVIFDYLEDYEDSTGEELELDVVAICCEFDEQDVDDIISNYRIDTSDIEQDEEGNVDEDEKLELVEEYLQNHTICLGRVGNCFVYAAF